MRKDGTAFSVEVHGSRFTYRGRPHTLGVIRDITERVEAYQLLEQRVEERTRELSTLLQISRNVASTLDPGPLLGLILEQLNAVVQYTGASVLTLEGDEFRQVEYRGPAPREQALALRIPLDTASAFWGMLSSRQPIAIADVRGDSPDAREYRRVLGEEILQRVGYVRAWLGVPLVVKDRVIGILALASGEVGHFTAEHARLVTAIATQAAVAIENARLYERAQEATALAERRLRELEALYRADAELYRSLRLDDVLNALVGVATEILQADKSTVMVWDEPRERLVVGAVQGFAPETVARMIHAPGEGVTSRVALTGQPIAVEDALSDPRVAHRITDREGIRSLVHVPIVVDGEVFGVFGVNYCQPHPVGADVQRLLLALAQRAALAIENARLYEQAQQVGILEERQRLARELHDSVSQALYGIALGARTARTLLDRDPSQVARPLEYVLSLAEAWLAEMRALIFELRPESLETEGLVAALDKQAAALRARHQIEVRADLGAEPALPLEWKEALYRIAQEATHNTVKHARAGAIDLRLRCDDGVCVLEVADDGIGFDPSGSFPGHLGLRSMRERAERLGGALELRSAPGAGTHLRALIPTGARVKREA